MLCCGVPGAAHSASELRTIQRSVPLDKSGSNKMLGNVDKMKLKPNDVRHLPGLLQNSQSLIKLHEPVMTPGGVEYNPLTRNISEIAQQVISILQSTCVRRPEILEMLRLLNGSVFKSFIVCHDQIALKNFMPVLPDIPHEVDEDDDATVKVIRLVKSPSEPLGATLQVHEETGCILVARVMHGGVADRCGLIQTGDEVREVNGIKVLGKSPDEVIRIMSNSTGSVTLTLVPTDCDVNNITECKMRVRAQFSYNPSEDPSIPCHEAGLSFQRGDILEIVSQEDDTWWQARRHGDDNPGHAGLIPSRRLIQQRESSKSTNAVIDNAESKGNKSVITKASPKMSKKIKKLKRPTCQQAGDVTVQDLSVSTEAKEADQEESIASYEQVERYIPNNRHLRPIVLVGPPGVGRSELKRKLMASDPHHFKEPVPYTSRCIRPGEVDGEEYHFVSRSAMENDILNKRYLEYGEYNGNLYGTTLDEIISIISSTHVCILCPKIQALRSIRCSHLRPFVVFVRPVTSLDRLITSRANSLRSFTNAELKEMIKVADDMDSHYGHYFDLTLVNDDLETASNDLRQAALELESQPQWIPTSWLIQ